MLLIYPPMAKPCEPPAGIARLAGALRGHRIPCTLLDANLEGQRFLLAGQLEPAGLPNLPRPSPEAILGGQASARGRSGAAPRPGFASGWPLFD